MDRTSSERNDCWIDSRQSTTGGLVSSFVLIIQFSYRSKGTTYTLLIIIVGTTTTHRKYVCHRATMTDTLTSSYGTLLVRY